METDEFIKIINDSFAENQPLPDGKYNVTPFGFEDHPRFIKVIDGKAHNISKQEYDLDDNPASS